METSLKVIYSIIAAVGVTGAIAVLTLLTNRLDKWRERRKQRRDEARKQLEVHVTESVEVKKLDYEQTRYFIELLDRERAEYKRDAEFWRKTANEAFATVRELTNEMAKLTHDVEILRQKERGCLETVAELRREMEELKAQVNGGGGK